MVKQIVEIAGTGITQITLYPMPLVGQATKSVLHEFVQQVMPRVEDILKR